MARGEQKLDGGMGEHLAFATLVASGYSIRITGQDSGRGTFSHRHAVLHDQKRERWDDGTYIPLQNVSDKQAPFTVIASVLSEEAVLDRKSVVSGKSVSVRVDPGGRRIMKKKKKQEKN